MLPTQEHLLKLLLEIDDICRRNDITFFLGYGTLIGAVRHEGFIPWDNDLDIIMDWDNYAKFREACERELDPAERTLQDSRYNREFSLVCGHYTDLTSCRMSSRTVFWEPLCGQYIDIFVAVELPGDINRMREQYNKYCAYDEFSNRVYVHQPNTDITNLGIYDSYRKRAAEIGRIPALEEIEADIFGHHYDDCEWCFTTSAHTSNLLAFIKKENCTDLIEVPFEGHMFKIPRNWSGTLALWYGENFNMFPAREKVHSEMSHSGLPAAAYVNDYMSFLKKEDILPLMDEFKETGVENAKRVDEDRLEFYQGQGYLVKRRIERQFERKGLDRQQLCSSTDPQDLKTLNPILSEYLRFQMNGDARGHRNHLKVGEDIEEAAWRVQAYWRYGLIGINHLAANRWYNKLDFTPAMIEVLENVERFRNVRRWLLHNEPKRAKEDLEYLKEQLGWMQQVKVFDLRYKLAIAQNSDELDACLVDASKILNEFPTNESCKKAKADTLLKLGRIDEALELYEEFERSSNDGLILLDIQKKRKAGILPQQSLEAQDE